MIKDIEYNLDILFPNAKCQLDYHDDVSLLIAIILSAQCSDVSVNKVTKKLFEKFKNIYDINDCDIKDLFEILKPLGLANVKSKNIKLLAKELCLNYDGMVPKDRSVIESFPGVGRKTCNVFLSEYYHIPNFAVDTHVLRVSRRLGLTDSDNPIVVEKKLCSIFDQDKWIKLHHQFIFFGRYLCKAKNPECFRCPFTSICSKD